jgi:hypothetical protein
MERRTPLVISVNASNAKRIEANLLSNCPAIRSTARVIKGARFIPKHAALLRITH